MHPRNRYQGPHNFQELIRTSPELADHLTTTPDGRSSLDFSNPDAVRYLNQALLLRDYGLKYWNIPPGSLCPGVPGRLNYIHTIADIIGCPTAPIKGKSATLGLDIGTGASLIYPILGVKEYGWRFVATDVDKTSLKVAGAIIKFNPPLPRFISLRPQASPTQIFQEVVRPADRFAFTMCNPPFFADESGARHAAQQKWSKLGLDPEMGYNFGGRPNELWTPGGEPAFLRRMIQESWEFRVQVDWFTTLVSKKGYLRSARQQLEQLKASRVRVVTVGQGGKVRRVLAWQFR